MKITEFIQGRNVTYQTVRKYIKRNEKLFIGHIGKRNNIVLDDTAISILEQKYPMTKPIEVIQDNENRDKLLLAQELIIKLQQELAESKAKIEDSKYATMFLPLETARADKAEANLNEEKKLVKNLTSQLEEEQERIEKLKDDLKYEISVKEKIENDIIKKNAEYKDLCDVFSEYLRQNSELRNEIEAFKKRSLWQRILNKD